MSFHKGVLFEIMAKYCFLNPLLFTYRQMMCQDLFVMHCVMSGIIVVAIKSY